MEVRGKMEPYNISPTTKHIMKGTYSKIIDLSWHAFNKDKTVPHNFSILDIGCGAGEVMELLKKEGFKVSGLDYDEKCVSLSSAYGPCLKGKAQDVDKLYKKNEFDLVLLSHVLEHFENPKEVIDKVKYVSKSWIVIGVPNLTSVSSIINAILRREVCEPSHICGWDYAHFRNLLENQCSLNIVILRGNHVRINPLPMRFYKSSVGTILNKFFPRIEKALANIFPGLSDSLIVLAEKRNI